MAVVLEAERMVEVVRESAHPLTGARTDYDPLMDLIGNAPLVLIGEATHGTQEFYHERAVVTQRLIEEKGFSAVAVEADWPDAYRVNRYVNGDDGATSLEALANFRRFPAWMWRNVEVLEFVTWLREHNDGLLASAPKPGFYGLDLYSLRQSIEAMLAYLEQTDPEAAARARYRYSCFEDFGEDPHAYGYAAAFGLDETCERQVVQQLVELQQRTLELARHDGHMATAEQFYAEQNARLVRDAETYYRTMFHGQIESWNVRDQHMADTLEALLDFLGRTGAQPKVVVWEHNSHLGDERATEMGQAGELNVGQLVRTRHGRDAVLVGQTTYTGTVTAASDWGGPAERKRVRPALEGSVEALFHSVGLPHFMLALRDDPSLSEALGLPQLERAIGVIYRPETERISHYLHTQLPQQFDVVIHCDKSQALEPLERTSEWERGEAPETYPFGV